MSDITIDIEYINRLGVYLSLFKKVRNNLWNARCPVCGDSKKNKYKKRFYIYQKDAAGYSVKCHNCGVTHKFPTFLKIYYPELYKQYMMDKIPYRRQKKQKHIKEIVKKKCKGFNYSHLKSFSDLSSNHPARIYVEKRLIPLDRVLYCPNFSKFIKTLGIDHYSVCYKNATEPRLIIPFYKRKDFSTVFQARAFSPDEKLRYITIKENDDQKKIFGLERIDKNETIYCTEGPIDAMMIPNCIAMSGISSSLPEGISPVFIYDNEPRNIDVVKNMKKRIRKGNRIVIFPKSIKFKDLNDMRVKGDMSVNSIMHTIEDNTYQGSIAEIKFNDWKRVNG